MTLKTYLKSLDGDTIVSIGARDGDAYMYIGEAGNTDLITKVFDDFRNARQLELRLAEKAERKLILSNPKLGRDDIENENAIHQLSEKIAKNYARRKKLNTYLRKYVKPLNRGVVEKNCRSSEEGIRIIITGKEGGDFWFKSEFDKRYSKKKV